MRPTALVMTLATIMVTGGLVPPTAGQEPQFLPAQQVGTVEHVRAVHNRYMRAA
jgi:hypothetical protein